MRAASPASAAPRRERPPAAPLPRPPAPAATPGRASEVRPKPRNTPQETHLHDTLSARTHVAQHPPLRRSSVPIAKTTAHPRPQITHCGAPAAQGRFWRPGRRRAAPRPAPPAHTARRTHTHVRRFRCDVARPRASRPSLGGVGAAHTAAQPKPHETPVRARGGGPPRRGAPVSRRGPPAHSLRRNHTHHMLSRAVAMVRPRSCPRRALASEARSSASSSMDAPYIHARVGGSCLVDHGGAPAAPHWALGRLHSGSRRHQRPQPAQEVGRPAASRQAARRGKRTMRCRFLFQCWSVVSVLVLVFFFF